MIKKNKSVLSKALRVHLSLESGGLASAFSSCRVPPKLGKASISSTEGGRDSSPPVSTFGAVSEAVIALEGADTLSTRLGLDRTDVGRVREILLAPLALVADQQRRFRVAAEARKRLKQGKAGQ